MGDLLYHEKQVAALCGVHCLNTLVQGPIYSEVELAQIAHEVDEMERQLMLESGMTSDDYQKFIAEGSGNVAADGMFSIQVLSKALQALNLHAIPLDNPDVRAAAREPQNEQAFICNLQEHWFTIRRLPSGWWNFNSLFPAPQPLSQFYLAAFLDSLKQQGYTIFVVRGDLPSQRHMMGEVGSQGAWFTPDEAKAANDEATTARQRGKAINAVENALTRAAAQGGALQLRPKRPAPSRLDDDEGNDDEDADLAAAIAASLGAAAPSAAAASGALPRQPPAQRAAASGGWAQAPGIHHNDGGDVMMHEDEEADLAAAIAASLADQPGGDATAAAAPAEPAAPPPPPEELDPEPEVGPGVVELAFRLPGGGRYSRRFRPDMACAEVYKALRVAQGLDTRRHVVTTQFPRKELPQEGGSSLAEQGITERQMLNVELKRG